MKATFLLGGVAPLFAIAIVFAVLFAPTAHAQPAALTLACKGTTNDAALPDEKTPISMGIIVNFSALTVQGFAAPGWMDYPVKITGANDVIIAFGGSHEILSSIHSINGTLDRVTGDVEATSILSDTKTGKIISTIAWALQCRPAQRMF